MTAALVLEYFVAFVFAIYGIYNAVKNGYYLVHIILGKEIVMDDMVRNNRVFTKLSATKIFWKFIGFSVIGSFAIYYLLVLKKFL